MCSTEHMSYLPYQNLQRWRLPNATFPFRFQFWQREWRLEIGYVNGAGHWRCMLEGPQHWYVCCGNDQADMERQLTVTGIAVPARTFAGTVFRRLEEMGLAERMHSLPH